MKTKLDGVLSQIMDKSWALGYRPDINKTLAEKRCLILSNKLTGKCALLGTMHGVDGTEHIEAIMINVLEWTWAEDEGFTLDDIIRP